MQEPGTLGSTVEDPIFKQEPITQASAIEDPPPVTRNVLFVLCFTLRKAQLAEQAD